MAFIDNLHDVTIVTAPRNKPGSCVMIDGRTLNGVTKITTECEGSGLQFVTVTLAVRSLNYTVPDDDAALTS